ncbi:MAG: hypothetical protein COB53_01185 [Elusimicrobia bacterium]|nr:MAG: hypothetical protein COB53_01185 [Elusimicrobiota bacterium]
MARRSTSGEMDSAAFLTRIFMRMHMAMCNHCKKFLSQMKLISNTVQKRFGENPDPARVAALKKRLLD